MGVLIRGGPAQLPLRSCGAADIASYMEPTDMSWMWLGHVAICGVGCGEMWFAGVGERLGASHPVFVGPCGSLYKGDVEMGFEADVAC